MSVGDETTNKVTNFSSAQTAVFNAVKDLPLSDVLEVLIETHGVDPVVLLMVNDITQTVADENEAT